MAQVLETDKITLSNHEAPGTRVVSLPIFGGTSAAFTAGSPATAEVTEDIYKYAISDRFKLKGVPFPILTDISAGLIKNFYAAKNIAIDGTTVPMLYRRYKTLYYGIVTGKGGSTGGSNNYMADERMGGGGGAGGACLFLISVASDTAPTFTKSENVNSKYTLTITCDGYTIEFVGGNGGNGSAGSGACTGGGGGGGAGGGAYLKIDGTEYRNQQYAGKYGPFYIVAVITNGTNGAGGGTWGGTGNAEDKAVEFNSTLKNAMGIVASVKWSRADDNRGSSAAPGVTTNGSTAWYGSGGQSGTIQYWSTTYSLG